MIRHATDTDVNTLRRYLSVFGNVLLWVVIAVNAWFLWPTSLGGQTALVIVSGESMEPTYSTGDLVIARKGEPQVGDVVVYRPEGYGEAQVVHRIVGGNAQDGWVIQGDNNSWLDPWTPGNEAIVGVVTADFPGVGLIGNIFLAPTTWVLVLLAAVGLFMWPERDDEDSRGTRADARRHNVFAQTGPGAA